MADGKTVKILIDVVANDVAAAKRPIKDIENEAKAANLRMTTDAKIKAKEIEAIHKETALKSKQTQKVIEYATKERVRSEIADERRLERERKRAADNFIQEIKKVNAAQKSASVGSGVGAGMFQNVLTFAPLAITAIAGFGVKSAMTLEAARNRFTALEGSIEKANIRIQKLLSLSRQSVGVNFEDALENFSQLNAIGGIAERNIESLIKAVGRLDVAFKLDSQKDFIRNLTQIFTQGFEASDIKEAIGRIPIFEQLLEKAFGTKDNEKLKQLKEQGKLTLDSFIQGFSDAVQNDTRLAGLNSTFSEKLSKAMTEVNIALAPLGQKIIDELQPIIGDITAELQKNQSWNDTGAAIGERLGKAIGEGLNKYVPNLVSGFIERMKSDLEGRTTSILLAVNISIGKGLVEGLTGREVNDIGEAFTALSDKFGDAVKAMAATAALVPVVVIGAMLALPVALGTIGVKTTVEAYKIGFNLVQGVINGIRDKSGELISYATSVIQTVINIWNQIPRIQSPSKETTEIGQYLVDGLIVGMKNKLPSLVVTAKDIAKKTLEIFKDMTTQFKTLSAENSVILGNFFNYSVMQAQLKTLQDTNAALKELAELRIKFGVNINAPITDATKEVEGYKAIETAVGDLIQKFRESLPKNEWKEILDLIANPAATKLIEEKAAAIGVTVEQLQKWAEMQKRLEFLKSIPKAEVLDIPSGVTPSQEGVVQVYDLEVQAQELSWWGDVVDQLRARLKILNEELPTTRELLTQTLAYLPQQVGDLFADAIRSGKDFFSTLKDGFRQMVDDILAQFARLFANKLTSWFLGKLFGGNTGGLFGNLNGGGLSGGGSSGGWLGSLLGLGRSTAVSGATALGLGSVAGTHALGAVAGGAPGALGSVIGGGAGVGGGLLGAGLGGGGATAGAAAGGGLGSLGALLTNPWTIAAVGAAVGGFLLWKMFQPSAEKKLKKAAETTYSPLKIKDKSILKSLKAIGEATFGKGQAGKKANEVVQLEQSQDLLKNYAENTGQKVDKFEGAKFFDAANPANHFADYGASAGQTAKAMFSGSGGGASSTVAKSSSGERIDRVLLAQVAEALNMFNEKFITASPNSVVMAADASAIADKYDSAVQYDARRTDTLKRNTNGF